MGSQYSVKATTICLFIIVTLAGCGGGGGDSTTSTPANIAPVANAGTDQALTLSFPDTRTIALTGTSSDSDGNVVAHQWDQTGGTSVTLTGADTSSATFTVDATTEAYSFSYTVTDDDGGQHSDTVLVYVTKILFSDSFAGLSNWTFENDTGDIEDWEVDNGELFQQNSVSDFEESYHTGTYAVLNGSAIGAASDYRFSVEITPLPNSDEPERQGNDVGIMFRSRDNNNNYYRVSMSARYGFTRFEKRAGGAFQTLAVNARGYVYDETILHPMTMTAEVNGDKLIVWINGDPIFAAVDADIASGTIALYSQNRVKFDNVLITEPPLQPVVVISTPLAYSVSLTQDDGNTLSAEAVVLNEPTGGSVVFRLDGGSDTATIPSVDGYAQDFFNLGPGEHELAALLRYADGTEANSDINSSVGTDGDYYVTVGDSITNGVGDFNPSNNDSFDERIIATQGYQAPLYNALWTSTRPVIVFNEGIGGDTAIKLSNRIDSIMKRHPRANRILLMIGTNDARLNVDANDYRDTVSAIILAHMNGRQVWLAKPMKTFEADTSISWTLDAARNGNIVQYNQGIDQIVNTIANTSLGPNFYFTFTDINPINYYYDDNLHPNDGGYGFMAAQWSGFLP